MLYIVCVLGAICSYPSSLGLEFMSDGSGNQFIYMDLRFEYPRTLRVLCLSENTNCVVWTAPKTASGRHAGLCAVRASHTMDRASLLTRVPEAEVEEPILGILDLQTKEYRSIAEKAYSASWSPDGKMIAFTQATGGIDSGNDPVTLGTWIYRVACDEVSKIYDKGIEVHWATFDGLLYIKDFRSNGEREVLKYNPVKRSLAPSKHKDINFSPDGKYYFTTPINTEEPFWCSVYESESDRMWEGPPDNPIPSWKFEIKPLRWLDRRTLVTDFWSPDYDTVKPSILMLNVETGEMYRTPYGVVSLTDNGNKVIEITGRGKHQIRALAELEKMTKETLHPPGEVIF